MANRKLQAALDAHLESGERALVETFAQLKQGDLGQRALKVGVSFVAAVATGGAGVGAMKATMPTLVWVIVSDRRLLMFDRPDGPRSWGELVFSAPLDSVVVTYQSGVRGGVVVDDALEGVRLVDLNTGLRKKAASAIAQAAQAR